MVDCTGGNELLCREQITASVLHVHRATSFRVKSCIRSRWRQVKKDCIAARMPAACGKEPCGWEAQGRRGAYQGFARWRLADQSRGSPFFLVKRAGAP